MFEIQIYLKFRFPRIKVRVASEQSVVEGLGLGQGHFPLHRLLPASDTPDGISAPSDSAGKACLLPSLYLPVPGLSVAVLTTASSPQHRTPSLQHVVQCISVPKLTDNLFVAFILIVYFLMMTETPSSHQ